jgi:hypothetical protein
MARHRPKVIGKIRTQVNSRTAPNYKVVARDATALASKKCDADSKFAQNGHNLHNCQDSSAVVRQELPPKLPPGLLAVIDWSLTDFRPYRSNGETGDTRRCFGQCRGGGSLRTSVDRPVRSQAREPRRRTRACCARAAVRQHKRCARRNSCKKQLRKPREHSLDSSQRVRVDCGADRCLKSSPCAG